MKERLKKGDWKGAEWEAVLDSKLVSRRKGGREMRRD
jgi:hypothetical protein